MKFRELLYKIQEIANLNGISQPFICGGVPRDKILNRLNDLNDVDLTTGDQTIKNLSKILTSKIQDANYLSFEDGHSSISIGDFKLDFSSNFNIPGINLILKQKGIQNPTSFQKEMFSRDFTCNSLLLSLDLKEIKDPTQNGMKDIEAKILRTCLSPEITLGYDNKRVVRIIYLASKLGFEVDPIIINWVRKNPQSISNVKSQYLVKKLLKSFEYDKEKTIRLLDSMGVWKFIPAVPSLSSYLVGRI